MPDPLIALLVAGAVVLLSLGLFLPKSGLVPRWRRAQRNNERVLYEDALKHIQRGETHGDPANLHSLAGALNISVNQAADILDKIQALNLVRIEGNAFRLTPEGREYALRIIRAHRLWEQYLAEETGFTEAEWHDQAEQYEHLLTANEAQALASQLGNPLYDPHGDPIPTIAGEFKPHQGKPLTSMEVDAPLRIVHIEDEPDAIYAQLVAEGLHAGMEGRILEKSPQRVRFFAGGDVHLLAPIVAGNISVLPVSQEPVERREEGQPLHELKAGQQGTVLSLSPRIRGAERRRLMDLGILPGVAIEAAFTSPSGDPTAYLVRETLIALRKEQARSILIASDSASHFEDDGKD